MSQDHARESAELVGRLADPLRHRTRAGIEGEDTTAVLLPHEVYVHPLAEVARMAPDTVGDLLGERAQGVGHPPDPRRPGAKQASRLDPGCVAEREGFEPSIRPNRRI